MQTDNVTEALERLRDVSTGKMLGFVYREQASAFRAQWPDWSGESDDSIAQDAYLRDAVTAADYALASTDERPLTREWLEAALGPADVPCVLGDSREAWFKTGTTWIEYKGGWALAMKGNHPHTLSITADAIAFFQLTRWPVSRQRIVEAWRKMR